MLGHVHLMSHVHLMIVSLIQYMYINVNVLTLSLFILYNFSFVKTDSLKMRIHNRYYYKLFHHVKIGNILLYCTCLDKHRKYYVSCKMKCLICDSHNAMLFGATTFQQMSLNPGEGRTNVDAICWIFLFALYFVN